MCLENGAARRIFCEFTLHHHCCTPLPPWAGASANKGFTLHTTSVLCCAGSRLVVRGLHLVDAALALAPEPGPPVPVPVALVAANASSMLVLDSVRITSTPGCTVLNSIMQQLCAVGLPVYAQVDQESHQGVLGVSWLAAGSLTYSNATFTCTPSEAEQSSGSFALAPCVGANVTSGVCEGGEGGC